MKPHTAAVLAGLATASVAFAGNGNWTLLGWNNLGMHCMDDDYEVFSILPPFNTVNAQLLNADGRLVRNPTGLTLTYEAIADPTGSINRTAIGKTNFWENITEMYGLGAPGPDNGLAGFAMPGTANTPQRFAWGGSSTLNWFEATGIPITPTDDAGHKNSYPLMRLKARDSQNRVLAQVDVVLPVSDEMDCRACHASGSGAAAKPAAGWVNDPNSKHDFRYNILRLHDEKHAGSALYTAALATMGYSPSGLFATAQGGTTILCAHCHSSEALPGSGLAEISPLTRAMHAKHANVLSPANGLALNASTNRSACYQCHPGSTTQCLRGAMGGAVDAKTGQLAMQCQSCHGSMTQVGATTRTGWLDEPNCQSCHTGTATKNSGQIRYTNALTSTGVFRTPADSTFATNPNTPAAGKSLYRFSQGHGGLQCSACHGSTHAEFPSVHSNDNIYTQEIQGHAGMIAECTACHKQMPETAAGGPHGLHPIGRDWGDHHHDFVGAQCQACHGSTWKGTVLSQAKTSRSFSTEHGTFTFWRGQTIGCYDCHNGPNGEGTPPAAPKVPTTATLSGLATATSLAVKITPSPTKGVTLRIVQQPAHGTVGVVGTTVTYYPFGGYKGADTFTYAGSNGTRDSNLGTATVTLK